MLVPMGSCSPLSSPLAPESLYRPHCSVRDPSVAESGACGAAPAAVANPQHVPVPLSAAWRSRMSFGCLDSAKSCSAARDRETVPRTPATEQGEEGLWKPCVGPLAHSCAAPLPSPPAGPSHACAGPCRRGKGTGFRQTVGMCPWCQQWLSLSPLAGHCCLLPPCPMAGGPAGPQETSCPSQCTTSCFHCAACASWVASAPSFPIEVRQEKGSGTGGSRKDPPRQLGPKPRASQGPRAASAQPCPSARSLCPEPGREPTSTATA